jgi:hypothetical protein
MKNVPHLLKYGHRGAEFYFIRSWSILFDRYELPLSVIVLIVKSAS